MGGTTIPKLPVSETPLIPVGWVAGLPAVFWSANAKVIEKYIAAKGLQPTALEGHSAGATRSMMSLADLGIRGGIKVPHLHLNKEIYVLSNELWSEFSANVIADAKKKLAKVQQVSFEDAVVLGSLAHTLAGG